MNISFHSKMEETLSELGGNIINIGSCGLHKVHNAFQLGATKTGWQLNYYLKHLNYLYKNVPARREDYVHWSGGSVFPLPFCQHRWVENSKVAQRAIDIHENVVKFVTHVDVNDVNLDTKPYQTVKSAI